VPALLLAGCRPLSLSDCHSAAVVPGAGPAVAQSQAVPQPAGAGAPQWPGPLLPAGAWAAPGRSPDHMASLIASLMMPVIIMIAESTRSPGLVNLRVSLTVSAAATDVTVAAVPGRDRPGHE
jgi:hypothetical protein